MSSQNDGTTLQCGFAARAMARLLSSAWISAACAPVIMPVPCSPLSMPNSSSSLFDLISARFSRIGSWCAGMTWIVRSVKSFMGSFFLMSLVV